MGMKPSAGCPYSGAVEAAEETCRSFVQMWAEAVVRQVKRVREVRKEGPQPRSLLRTDGRRVERGRARPCPVLPRAVGGGAGAGLGGSPGGAVGPAAGRGAGRGTAASRPGAREPPERPWAPGRGRVRGPSCCARGRGAGPWRNCPAANSGLRRGTDSPSASLTSASLRTGRLALSAPSRTNW